MDSHPENISDIVHLLPDTATLSSAGVLHIANHSIPELAREFGTPLYIFDSATIIHACNRYKQAFRTSYSASATQLLYAAKAYLSPLVARFIAEQEMGLDVVSAGELLVAESVNFPRERISFHGNNKSEAELRLALKLNIGRIVLDNWSELEHLTLLAQKTQQRPGVLLRVAPGIDTDTHPYMQTGHANSKFGFPLLNGEAKGALLRILEEGRLRLLGLHAHTGTMLRETRPYQECIESLLALAEEVYNDTGWWPEELSPGGGWAIDEPGSEAVPEIEELARTLQESMLRGLTTHGKQLPPPRLIIEPGRSIIARAGIAIYRVGVRKLTSGGVTYIFVDGGMADNIRPALYGARYTALAVERMLAPNEERVCISGRYCESGDMLIESIELPRMHEGELLAIPTVGAYCLPFASNYNLVPRPAVLMVADQQVQLMERRETVADLLARYQ